MAEDPSQGDGAPSQPVVPGSPYSPQASDVALGSPGDGTGLLRPRPRPVFRGHIVADDDEPMAVFDAPAEPPPPPLAR